MPGAAGGSGFDRPKNDRAEEEKGGESSLLDLKESSNAAALSAFDNSDTGCVEEAAMPILSLSLSLALKLSPRLSLSRLSRHSVILNNSMPLPAETRSMPS